MKHFYSIPFQSNTPLIRISRKWSHTYFASSFSRLLKSILLVTYFVRNSNGTKIHILMDATNLHIWVNTKWKPHNLTYEPNLNNTCDTRKSFQIEPNPIQCNALPYLSSWWMTFDCNLHTQERKSFFKTKTKIKADCNLIVNWEDAKMWVIH